MYFVFFIVLTIAVMDIARNGHLANVVAIGVVLGTFGYLLYNVILFHRIGYSYFNEIFSTILRMDTARMTAWFPYRLFSCSLSGSCQPFGDNDMLQKTSLRVLIAASLAIYVALINTILLLPWGKSVRLFLMITMGICIFLSFFNLSRANILAIILILLLGWRWNGGRQ